MAYAFVSNGNEPLLVSHKEAVPGEVRDVHWFREQLQARKVSRLEIAWGDHISHFSEVPPSVMDAYLHHRQTLLHAKALELSLLEAEAMETHPFAP